VKMPGVRRNSWPVRHPSYCLPPLRRANGKDIFVWTIMLFSSLTVSATIYLVSKTVETTNILYEYCAPSSLDKINDTTSDANSMQY
jgi:hypothetical protein